jgi:hypothetical protein
LSVSSRLPEAAASLWGAQVPTTLRQKTTPHAKNHVSHNYDQGEQVNATKHNAKTLSAKTGFFAVLATLLHDRGRSAPSPSPCRRLVPAALAAIAVVLTVGAVPALAINAPAVSLECNGVTHTSIGCTERINTGGYETKWKIEYATSQSGEWHPVPGGAGTIPTEPPLGGNSQHPVKAELAGLTPETVYYFRAEASSQNPPPGMAEAHSEAVPLHPLAFIRSGEATIANRLATSAHVHGKVNPVGFETQWYFEYAPAEADGSAPAENSPSWVRANGAEGVITKAEAESIPLPSNNNDGTGAAEMEAKLTGLVPSTVYYVRLFAEDEPEPGVHKHATSAIYAESSFETEGPPAVSTFSVHALHVEALRLLGTVRPNSVPTSEEQTVTIGGATGGVFTLTFVGQTTAPIPFDATPSEVAAALNALPGLAPKPGNVKNVAVSGKQGAYAVHFDVELREKDEPQITADASGLTPLGTGTVNVSTSQNGGEGLDTHYHFEYVAREGFEQGGFANPATESTPVVDLGLGTPAAQGGSEIEFVGTDLSGLEPGKTYDYRLSATNTSPGDPVIDGSVQTLTVPVSGAPGSEAECPNEAFRTGPSAHLPDCRAYEQLTPVDKEGAMEAFRFGLEVSNQGVLTGEDGNHVVFSAPFVTWGFAGESPYVFSRTGGGWGTTAGTPQPEAGVDHYSPELFNPDITMVAFSAGWNTGVKVSPNVEFRTGPPGGPYLTAAIVPRALVGSEPEGGPGGWVAASEDFTKLILQVEDSALVVGHRTGTSSGFDLYEYVGGKLRQANVLSDGATVGSCGAKMVRGAESHGGAPVGESSRHAVSADGSRVFFEAVPSTDCSQPTNLYMREAGSEKTVDIGACRFLAADREGSEVLLERANGTGEGSREVLLYNTESGHSELLFSVPGTAALKALVSDDFTALYLSADKSLSAEAPAGNGLYLYDMRAKTLRYLVRAPLPFSVSPDGRYAYIEGKIAGLPSGAPVSKQEEQEQETQAFRYDSHEDVVECISCASAFDAEPKHQSFFRSGSIAGARSSTRSGLPRETVASANGDFAFFDTVNALVPQDVDGEVAPELHTGEFEFPSSQYSPSSDVYEWRRDGIDGCAHLQGCVSLISSGQGGKIVMLLGSAAEGRDVIFSTASQLGAADNDSAIDIYDARIGGGFPAPAPRPTECEGDACSTPAGAPNDPTPTLLPFSGAVNLPGATKPKPKAKKKPKKKKGGRRAKKKAGRKARRSVRARHARTSGRAGK